MNKTKTCMVTGHRKLRPDKIRLVRRELRREVVAAIEEGYTYFISGFECGTDLLFADIVTGLKEKYPIRLEAQISHKNRINSSNKRFRQLIAKCDAVCALSEVYSPAGLMRRNRFMVQSSDRVIVVYDGRETGNTRETMCFAYEMNKDIRLVLI